MPLSILLPLIKSINGLLISGAENSFYDGICVSDTGIAGCTNKIIVSLMNGLTEQSIWSNYAIQNGTKNK